MGVDHDELLFCLMGGKIYVNTFAMELSAKTMEEAVRLEEP